MITKKQEQERRTCEELIESSLILRQSQATEALDEWEDLSIGYDKETVHTIILSWGGPSDFLKVYQAEDGYINKIEYHYQDWFDGAVRLVEKGSPMWFYATMYIGGE